MQFGSAVELVPDVANQLLGDILQPGPLPPELRTRTAVWVIARVR
jgi:hypothetical protein